MASFDVLLLPGDGIGPEVMAETKKVMSWLAKQKKGDGYALYDSVSKADIQALSDALTAVSEQVGKIGAALAQQ